MTLEQIGGLVVQQKKNLLKAKDGWGLHSPDFDVIDNPIVVTFASLGF